MPTVTESKLARTIREKATISVTVNFGGLTTSYYMGQASHRDEPGFNADDWLDTAIARCVANLESQFREAAGLVGEIDG